MLRRHHKITLIFPIFVIEKHNHFARTKILNQLFNG